MLVSLGTILRFIFLCRFPYNVLFMNVWWVLYVIISAIYCSWKRHWIGRKNE
jgi:hypothetical protein